MASNTFIVSACNKYTPELCALLNSLDYVGSKADVHVIGINLPEEFTSQFNRVNYSIIYHKISQEEIEEGRGISEITCRKRYWYAAKIGLDYNATCILDADLIFVRDPYQFFNIAEKTGYILGPCKEQNKAYNHEHHFVYGKWIWNIPFGYYGEYDLCNCPLFLDTKIWHDALIMSWDIFLNGGFRAPDMDAMNLCFFHYNSLNKTIKLPGNQWLGTNEQHLKPYIRVIDVHGKMCTENGLQIFSYHGQYYKEKWRNQQLLNRHECAKNYLKTTESTDAMARGSMNLLYENFKKMLDYKIIIEKKDYIPV